MARLLCIILVEMHTGYGIYAEGRQMVCEYVRPDIGGLHWVDCGKAMDNLRLSENTWINNPIQWVRIAEKDEFETGKECFYVN